MNKENKHGVENTTMCLGAKTHEQERTLSLTVKSFYGNKKSSYIPPQERVKLTNVQEKKLNKDESNNCKVKKAVTPVQKRVTTIQGKTVNNNKKYYSITK